MAIMIWAKKVLVKFVIARLEPGQHSGLRWVDLDLGIVTEED